MEQVEENIRAMTEPFAEPDAKILSAQLEYIRPVYCRMCGQCEGSCSRNLPVADMLRSLMYAEGYGQFPLARESYRALASEARAARCDDCNACTVACPHGIDVAARLSRARELLA